MIILSVGVANLGHLRPFNVRSRTIIPHPIYRASSDGDGDGDGGGGGGGGSRQADYAVCKNRSRGIPFVRRQKQPCVTAGVGDAGKEISCDEGYRPPLHRVSPRV